MPSLPPGDTSVVPRKQGRAGAPQGSGPGLDGDVHPRPCSSRGAACLRPVDGADRRACRYRPAHAVPRDDGSPHLSDRGAPAPLRLVSAVAVSSTSWLELAGCRGRPTAWWYPRLGDAFTAAVAKTVCRSCPVRAECLADAIAVEADGFVFGIRGGLNAAERRALPERCAPIMFVRRSGPLTPSPSLHQTMVPPDR